MKQIIKFSFLVLLMVLLTQISCKKEYSCENCNQNGSVYKPPIANAGPDQVITLPTDSVSLDGQASSDPDGMISSFLWTKISGPASFIINNSTAAMTSVKNLSAGSYQFELKVTDAGGLFSKDTMRVIVDAVITTNHPPVANAGPDQTITLPANTVNLNGSNSTDPDNNIISYAWTKISGPSSFNIINVNAVQTQVTNLVQGVYQFEVKVTDGGGLFSKDTTSITVNPLTGSCNIAVLSVGTLSNSRSDPVAGAVGNKIFFAGGYTGSGSSLIPSSRVDIYNTATQSWSTAELSIARYGMATATSGNKIFFAAGIIDNLGHPSTRVDIYDASTNTWSITELSIARPEKLAAASVGNKVVFAGSGVSTLGLPDVDIYDISTNAWSTSMLPEPKIRFAATSLGNKIYFSGGLGGNSNGGVSNEVDIYNALTNGWSTISMTVPRWAHGSISADNKLFWFGGDSWFDSNGESISTNTTEIYDINTSSRVYHRPTGDLAATKSNKILFFSGQYQLITRVEIYTIDTQTWSNCEIVNPAPVTLSAAITVGNSIYIQRNSEILKLVY